MGFLLRLPLIVILAGIGALAMVLPGLYAHAQNLHKIGSIFLGAAGLFFLLSVILALATANAQTAIEAGTLGKLRPLGILTPRHHDLGQSIRGVPVLGGEYVVNLDDDNNLLSVLGESSPVTDLGVTPAISAKAAAAKKA